MNAARFLMDLAQRGIRLEAHGDRLRYHPRSALTPELVARLKAHKDHVLLMLQPVSEVVQCLPQANQDAHAKPVCQCGSETWRDDSIHGGQSIRRDCGHCGRFLEFLVWYDAKLDRTASTR